MATVSAGIRITEPHLLYWDYLTDANNWFLADPQRARAVHATERDIRAEQREEILNETFSEFLERRYGSEGV